MRVLGVANGSVHVARLRVAGAPYLVRSQVTAVLTNATDKRFRNAVGRAAEEALTDGAA